MMLLIFKNYNHMLKSVSSRFLFHLQGITRLTLSRMKFSSLRWHVVIPQWRSFLYSPEQTQTAPLKCSMTP